MFTLAITVAMGEEPALDDTICKGWSHSAIVTAIALLQQMDYVRLGVSVDMCNCDNDSKSHTTY